MNHEYFIAIGMAAIAETDDQICKVMDYIRDRLSNSDKEELLFEKMNLSLYTAIREHLCEKRMR